MPGFQFTETMTGHYHKDGRERSFGFQATARADSVWQFLRDRRATLEGVVDADSLADGARMEGSVLIDPFVGRVIRYEFDFAGADGKRYRFVGQKDVTPLHPLDSMTTLPGEILDSSHGVYARTTLHFHSRDLLPMIASFRPVL